MHEGFKRGKKVFRFPMAICVLLWAQLFCCDGSATELHLDGLLNDGTVLQGSDAIRIVPPGDANGDGAVDGVDFGIWQAAYPTAAPVAGATVPEPGTLGMLIMGGLALLR